MTRPPSPFLHRFVPLAAGAALVALVLAVAGCHDRAHRSADRVFDREAPAGDAASDLEPGQGPGGEVIAGSRRPAPAIPAEDEGSADSGAAAGSPEGGLIPDIDTMEPAAPGPPDENSSETSHRAGENDGSSAEPPAPGPGVPKEDAVATPPPGVQTATCGEHPTIFLNVQGHVVLHGSTTDTVTAKMERQSADRLAPSYSFHLQSDSGGVRLTVNGPPNERAATVIADVPPASTIQVLYLNGSVSADNLTGAFSARAINGTFNLSNPGGPITIDTQNGDVNVNGFRADRVPVRIAVENGNIGFDLGAANPGEGTLSVGKGTLTINVGPQSRLVLSARYPTQSVAESTHTYGPLARAGHSITAKYIMGGGGSAWNAVVERSFDTLIVNTPDQRKPDSINDYQIVQ